MVVFLANRANLQNKRLHDRIQNRLSGEFENVRRRRAEPREAGPYRIVADTARKPTRSQVWEEARKLRATTHRL